MTRLYEAAAYATGPESADGTNYWRTTVDPEDTPSRTGDAGCETAVIGAGVTGLNAALHLAREHGQDVIVLDAQDVGFGASGRAGGFCCLGGARLSEDAIEARLGTQEAARWFRAERAAVDLVAETLEREGIDADTHSDGETLLAHSPGNAKALRDGLAATERRYGLRPVYHDTGDLAARGMGGAGFHGGVTIPAGFALNPLKYTLGLAAAARGAGVDIRTQCPVTALDARTDGVTLTTPTGRITARRVIVATNGYSSDDLPVQLHDRFLPVQSSILVTRPITPGERAAQGWSSHQMCYDTRHLLHYFRLMPDGRMLFGLRGAVKAGPAAQSRARARARRDFDRMFPAWRTVETPHFWSGLLAFSRSFLPFAGRLDPDAPVFGALAYHGNGIAMGSLAGREIARIAVGEAGPGALPEATRAPMRRFGLGRYRRWSLAAAYPAYRIKDLLG